MAWRYYLLTFWVPVVLVFAQDPYGRVTGAIVDSGGASVPNAAVRVVNTETNVVTTAASDTRGNYLVRNLLPGQYRLEVELQGFKRYQRSPLEVRVGDTVTVDVVLELGVLTESVTVTAEAPLLETGDASIGQVIDSRRVQDLPTPANSVIYLAQLTPGVIATNSPTHDWGPNQPEVVSGQAAGGDARSNEYLVDGVPNMKSSGVVSYQPMPEIVREFRVQTAAYDASAGHYTGARINMVTKSGTNKLQGTVAFSYNGRALSTRPFFVNKRIYDLSTGPVTKEKIDAAFPNSRLNRYRISGTGPVFIPNLYDGRNRTFWTFGSDRYLRTFIMQVSSLTVPTMAQRTGDFSALLALGSQYQIYDPFTTTLMPDGRLGRTPLPGNIVPASRISPTAKMMLEYIPKPNVAGNPDGTANYTGSPLNDAKQQNTTVRIDHVRNEQHRFFVSLTRPSEDTTWGNTGFEDKWLQQHHLEKDWFLSFDNVLTPNSTTIVNLRYGLMRHNIRSMTASAGKFDLKSMGFADSLVSKLDPTLTAFPVMSMTGYSTVGSPTGRRDRRTFHFWSGNVSQTRGGHNLRAGAEYRITQQNNANYGNVTPQLTFTATYTNGPTNSSPAAPIGQSFASLLFGLLTGGGIDRNAAPAVQSEYLATYLQDDWKVTRRLTLNIGLRWEVEFPTTERFNRINRGFDFETLNPVHAEALANYANSPIPELPVTSFQVRGGLLFAGVNGVPPTYWNTNWRNLAPRVGLAYLLGSKTVIRAGYGIFWGPMAPDTPSLHMQGFSQRTIIVPSVDQGLSFEATLANPFPNGIVEPAGSANGLRTFLGNAVGFFDPNRSRPYIQRWSFNIQREFPSRVLLDVGYSGNRGTRTGMAENFNATPAQYLSRSPVRDQELINYLSVGVSNPFYGMPETVGTFLGGTTVSRAHLLAAFPHFNTVGTTVSGGYSWYHSLQVRAEKRMTRGFTINASYTWMKLMRAYSKLNATDPYPERVISTADRPHRIVVSAIYELPIGKRRTWLANAPGWLNNILGGWSVQAIYQGQSGPPLTFGNIAFYGDIHDIVLPRSERRVERWFNTDAGFEKDARQQLAYNIRTFPSALTGLRGDGYNNWDLSLFKNFRIAERFQFQLRAEAQDALNHAMFAAPITTPTSGTFGQVTKTVSGTQRVVTISGRLTW